MPRRRRPAHTRALLRAGACGVAATVTAALAPVLPASARDPQPPPPVAADAVGSDHRLSPLVDTTAGVYIVTLSAPTLTRGASGASRAEQRGDQDRVLQAVGAPRPIYRYTTALNGFAVALQPDQVDELRGRADVVSVERDTTAQLDSLAGAALARWRQAELARRRPTERDAGTGIVIGFLDSGIWPANPAFDGLASSPGLLSRAFPHFSGQCQAGESWPTTTCTTKVVGARWFADGFRAANPAGVATADYLSARDWSGHGSLSASVAAGNPGITMSVDGRRLGQTAGVAPGAGIAAYKVCWTAPDPNRDGCRTSDVVRGVDQASIDGVDVLSYPASAPVWEGRSAVADALRGAASEGVAVMTSAGNTGPLEGTVHADGPWAVTVAASGGQRFRGTVRLGDGTQVDGAMLSSAGTPPSRLVDARTAASSSSTPTQAALCAPGTLSPDRVARAVVICRRGQVSRVEKSETVASAGGRGMVLVNTRAEETASDFHAVPTVHLTRDAGRRVLAYAASTGAPTASMTSQAADRTARGRVPLFSSRGPTLDGRVLKPDLAAPGLNVPGAAAPPTNEGRIWTVGTGTSVATAYVAGAAAVLARQHPDWSPAAVRSALMTSSRRGASTNLFATGSGDLTVRRALDPGLVLDASPVEWERHSAGEADDVNQASVSVSALMGRTSVVRTFTNVGDTPETYTARVAGLPGVQVVTRPATFTVRPGESQRVRLVLEASRRADYDGWSTGYVTWRGSNGHAVRMPVAARPVLARLPENAHATGRQVRLEAAAGVTGALRLSSAPVVAPVVHRAVLVPSAFDTRPGGGASTTRTTYTVPPGSPVARFRAAPDADAALDLYVYRGDELVGAAIDTRQPTVTLRHPEAGTYHVTTELASGPSRLGVTVRGWVVPAGPAPGSARLRLARRRMLVDGGAPFTVIGDLVEPRGTGRHTEPLLGAVLLDGTDELTVVSIP